MNTSLLNSVRIILIEPRHPGNIGAVARAMKTMGLTDLFLFNPVCFPSGEATARAVGADDVLNAANVVSDLDVALADCTHIMGTSARLRGFSIPCMTARAAATLAQEKTASGERIAIIFGPEASGLCNAHLQRCHTHIVIPSNPDFSSLNLASAVQIIAYELFQCASAEFIEPPPKTPNDMPATTAEVEGFYTHLQEALHEIGVIRPDAPRFLMAHMKRLYQRVQLSKTEVNLLRGICKAMIEKKNN